MKKTSNKGFTLVELIIVIAILAIIMLIAIPNFSGIQQRMQVRADKSTAAQIGKAVRIWYTEYNSDPAFKAQVGANGLAAAGEEMVELKDVALIDGYVDKTLEPTSLRLTDGTTDPNQKYFVGLVGSGTYEKVVVCIAGNDTENATAPVAPTAPGAVETAGLEGTTGINAKDDVLYDGTPNAETAGEPAHFKAALAYMEP